MAKRSLQKKIYQINSPNSWRFSLKCFDIAKTFWFSIFQNCWKTFLSVNFRKLPRSHEHRIWTSYKHFFSFEWSKQAMSIKLNNDLDLWEQDSLVGEGGGLGSVFTGYVLLVSQNPCPCPYPYPDPIVVFSVTDHILHLSHFLGKCNFHNLDIFTWSFKLVSMWSPLYDEYLLMLDYMGAFFFFFFNCES